MAASESRWQTTLVLLCSCLFVRLCHGALDARDEKILKDLDTLKVYIYDLEGAGFSPPLSMFARDSLTCTDPKCSEIRPKLDLCNYGLGKPRPNVFGTAIPFQNVSWTNTRTGQEIGLLMHHRIMTSKYLTNNPDEADLFFIPLMIPMVCQHEWWYELPGCGFSFMEYTKWEEMWEWFLKQPSFVNSDGSDHFMMMARTWLNGQKCPAVMGNQEIDGHHYNLSANWPELKERVGFRVNNTLKLLIDRDTLQPRTYPVPYATDFHYIPSKLPQSLEHIRPTPDSFPISSWRPELVMKHHRPIFASHAASSRPPQKTPYWQLKRQVFRICLLESECVMLDIYKHEKTLPRLLKVPDLERHLQDANFGSVQDYADLLAIHHEALNFMSTFCIQPGGDTPTRKGLFDSIMVGCIPVIFYPQSAEYPWHLPISNISSFAVYIPPVAVMSEDGYLIKHLKSISPEDIRAKQEAMVKLVNRVQWSAAELSAEDHARMGPDAMDITMWNLLRETQAVRAQNFHARFPHATVNEARDYARGPQRTAPNKSQARADPLTVQNG